MSSLACQWTHVVTRRWQCGGSVERVAAFTALVSAMPHVQQSKGSRGPTWHGAVLLRFFVEEQQLLLSFCPFPSLQCQSDRYVARRAARCMRMACTLELPACADVTGAAMGCIISVLQGACTLRALWSWLPEPTSLARPWAVWLVLGLAAAARAKRALYCQQFPRGPYPFDPLAAEGGA